MVTCRVNRLWSSYRWFGDERDVTNGTPSPLSNRLSPMCAIGEQIESEFGLMTLNTVVTHQNGHLHLDTQGLARSAGKTQRTGGDDRGKGQ